MLFTEQAIRQSLGDLAPGLRAGERPAGAGRRERGAAGRRAAPPDLHGPRREGDGAATRPGGTRPGRTATAHGVSEYLPGPAGAPGHRAVPVGRRLSRGALSPGRAPADERAGAPGGPPDVVERLRRAASPPRGWRSALAWPVDGAGGGLGRDASPSRCAPSPAGTCATPAMLRRLLAVELVPDQHRGRDPGARARSATSAANVLSQLPERPDFLICATDMAYGVSLDLRARPDGRLPGAVTLTTRRPTGPSRARSPRRSCFPPVFNPLPVGLPPHELSGARRRRARRATPWSRGSASPTAGCTTIWRWSRCGGPRGRARLRRRRPVQRRGGPEPALARIRRYAAIPENQAVALRKRWLISNFLAGVMDGAYWGISSATEQLWRRTRRRVLEGAGDAR